MLDEAFRTMALSLAVSLQEEPSFVVLLIQAARNNQGTIFSKSKLSAS